MEGLEKRNSRPIEQGKNSDVLREQVGKAEQELSEAAQKLKVAQEQFEQKVGITNEERTRRWREISQRFDNINKTLNTYGFVGAVFPSLAGFAAPYAVDAYVKMADKFEVVDYSAFAERGLAVSAVAAAIYGLARIWSHFARKKAEEGLLDIPTKK